MYIERRAVRDSSVCLLAAIVIVAGSVAAAESTTFALDSLTSPVTAAKPHLAEGYGKLPISFEPNVGQAPAAVRYVARGRGYNLSLADDGLSLSLRQGEPAARNKAPAAHTAVSKAASHDAQLYIRMAGAASHPQIRAEARQASVSNYFIGNDPANYHTGVANYGAVRYSEIYPGIDWKVYGNPQQLEYDLIVAPKADPDLIKLRIEGADQATIDADGSLLLSVNQQSVRQHPPVVYQEASDGQRIAVPARYKIKQAQPNEPVEVGFALGDYDRSRMLTIDPVLVYSTYLGSFDFYEEAFAIAVDSAGNAYVAGKTGSTSFPLTDPIQAAYAGGIDDAFVTKLNGSGSAKLYSTYLGGNGLDEAHAIAVDGAGNAYVAGRTNSINFPTSSPLQAANAGTVTAFITKLNAGGSALVYSTYLGGSGGDEALAIAVDSAGNAYVAGGTHSADFPTTRPLQAANAGYGDAFVTKINASGSAKVYSTYLGGSGYGEVANAIAVDSTGSAYVAGTTSSTDFPTTAALQAVNNGGQDAFITKLNPSGNARVYSTYLGGSGSDVAYGVAVDGAGNAYLAGATSSLNFPTASPLQAINGDGGHFDAFIAKLNVSGSAFLYSTYLGGEADDYANAVAVDSAGNAYIAGVTGSTNFPTASPLQAPNADHSNSDAFVIKLNASGSALVYSTNLGGRGSDDAAALAVDSAGNAYVTGITNSMDFPTVMPLQERNVGGYDAFIAKLGEPGAVTVPNKVPLGNVARGNTSPTKRATIKVGSAGSVRFSGASLSGPNFGDFAITADTCSGHTIAANRTCAISLRLTANQYVYSETAKLSIVDSAGTQTVPLSGVSSPQVTLSPATINFGRIIMGASSATKNVIMRNNQSVTVGSVSSLLPVGPFHVTADTCNGMSLAAFKTCVVSLVFTPTGTGTVSNTLTLSDGGPDTASPYKVPLSGIGQ